MLVTGKEGAYESEHSIFLPAAGLYYDGYGLVLDQGGIGYYWSPDLERFLFFGLGFRLMNIDSPSYGVAVRPVSE